MSSVSCVGKAQKTLFLSCILTLFWIITLYIHTCKHCSAIICFSSPILWRAFTLALALPKIYLFLGELTRFLLNKPIEDIQLMYLFNRDDFCGTKA